MAKLADLTRENSQRLSVRLKRWLWENGLALVILIGAVTYGGSMIYDLHLERGKLKKALDRVIFESGMKGCPVYHDGRTTFIISAATTEEARNVLGRIANEADDFHAAINKVEKVKGK